MKIDSEFVKKIFNLEIKIKKNEDKIKLSKYEELIPIYYIYSQKIYPINKQNIHYRLIDSHYRFVNYEIFQWIKNLYDKNSHDKNLGPRFKYNIDLMNNYDIDTLIETSYKALYKYSPLLGLLVSICKRNSFHPFILHLKPYYTKLELIKLGQNMDIVKSNIDPEYLIDQETHYNICKSVSKNDVSFWEIKLHHEHILKTNIISWVCFYSWTGSFLFNKYLRNLSVNAIRANQSRSRQLNTRLIDTNYLNGLIKIVKSIEQAPALTNNYDIYRFIWDDSFIMGMKEGELFIDKGFLSTTRDPFYSPGLNGNFGLILIKITIPKNKKGVGLFIENFSLFPKEEEFLLPPYSKLKLVSKNDKFKYYHTNPEFEKLINRKYEFELIDIDYALFYKQISEIHPVKSLQTQPEKSLQTQPEKSLQTQPEKLNYSPIDKITIAGTDRINLIKAFIQTHGSDNKINLLIGSNKYSFGYQWFDSSETSSYNKFYWNKMRDGLILSIFDSDGYPYLNIEIGKELIINYINQMYFTNTNYNLTQSDLDLIYHLGRIFYYKSAIIFQHYSNFNIFESNYSPEQKVFLSMKLFNQSIYQYLKSGEKYLSFDPFINYDLGYWYLDEYFNKKLSADLIDKNPIDKNQVKSKKNNTYAQTNTYKELFIECIEKNFNYMDKLIDQFDKNIFKNNWVKYNIYERLVAEGLSDNFRSDLEHTNDDLIDDTFKLIFRQPIRRLL